MKEEQKPHLNTCLTAMIFAILPGVLVKKNLGKKYNHKYHDKTRHKILYKEFLDIFNLFNSEEKLIEMFHPYDTQVNEGLNT